MAGYSEDEWRQWNDRKVDRIAKQIEEMRCEFRDEMGKLRELLLERLPAQVQQPGATGAPPAKYPPKPPTVPPPAPGPPPAPAAPTPSTPAASSGKATPSGASPSQPQPPTVPQPNADGQGLGHVIAGDVCGRVHATLVNDTDELPDDQWASQACRGPTENLGVVGDRTSEKAHPEASHSSRYGGLQYVPSEADLDCAACQASKFSKARDDNEEEDTNENTNSCWKEIYGLYTWWKLRPCATHRPSQAQLSVLVYCVGISA